MACSGCEKRRSIISVWWRSLWPSHNYLPGGVPGALKLANQLQRHCDRYGISGVFAGVTVPPEKDTNVSN